MKKNYIKVQNDRFSIKFLYKDDETDASLL